MGVQPNTRTLSYLPQVVLATGLIAVAPIALVWVLHASDAITSAAPLIAIAITTSLLMSQAGAAVWKRRRGAGDLLFGELMVWGWLRRLWNERRLASAIGMIGAAGGAGKLDPEQQAERLERLSAALEASDPYTHGHSRRVARHSATIAKHLRLSPEQVARVRTAAAVHDVGKINTPTGVLRKAGSLTAEEFDVIKRHAADGAEIVATLDDAELTQSVLHHHERLDGSGYPAGLSGEQIPIGARIIAVADTFDAIASTRPYRRAKPHREALGVLARESGSRLDSRAVQAFLGHYSNSRPLAVWTALASVPERMLSILGGGLNAGSAAVASAGVAAVTALGVTIADAPPGADASRPAGSPAAARVASASTSGRDGDSKQQRDRGPKGDRSKPAPSSTATAPAPSSAGIGTGSEGVPIQAADPGGGGGGLQPGAEPPRSGTDPAPPGPDVGQPDGDETGDDDPGGLHLLPHLPAGPHLPHVPGFEDD